MPPPSLILYQRDDCHLCDLALEAMAQARSPAFESVFIDGDDDLETVYGTRVPVLRDAAGARELDWPFDAGVLRAWLASLALLTVPLGTLAALPAGGDVDLVKSASRPDAARWTGLAITDVVPAGSIQRIVMTRAITSAPGDVDLGSIRSLLSGTYGPARPQERPGPRGLPQLGGAASIWEGVVVLESGAIIGFVIESGTICLRGAEGEMACWRR